MRSGVSPIFKSLFFLAIALGIFFRFVSLDKKGYWFDEAFTSLRVSGFTDAEVIDRFRAKNQIVGVTEFKKYQSPQPERGIVDTVRGLVQEEPQNPPLYFVLAKFWADLFGGSIVSMRSLPAILGLLVLPCVYWLSLELFGSHLTGWIAISLISLSPFHVLAAQTARPQSLWTATIVFSAAALLRAMRLKTNGAWLLYAIGLTLSLYTFVLSGLFAAGYGLYVLIVERGRLTRSLVSCLIASALSGLAFAPWAIAMFASRSNISTTTSWAATSKLSISELLRAWVTGYARLFFDINNQSDDPLSWLLPLLVLLPLLLTLLGYALYFLYLNSSRRTWLFVFLLIGSAALPLMLADLISGGGRLSAAYRYLIPAYMGIQLAISFLVTAKLSSDVSTRERAAWQAITAFILLLGAVSCWTSSRAESWWNKDPEGVNPEIARIINRSEHPLIVSDDRMGALFSLSSVLQDKVQLLIEPRCYVCARTAIPPVLPQIPPQFSNVFFFRGGLEPGAYSEWLKELTEAGKAQPLLTQHGRVILWAVSRFSK